MNLLNADRAVKDICEVKDGKSFFFMVGAGVSRPPVPAAREMISEWKQIAEQAGRLPGTVNGDSLSQYETFFKSAFTSNRARQDYIRTKIQDQLLPPASYKLAKIVHDGRLTRIVVTTNFDTFVFKALGYLGADPLLYDHPQTAKARFLPMRDEPQLLHVHGTYLFYDCANLKGQITGVTASMLELLEQLLAERSPIIIGYSGWPEDVFMSALKKRLESGITLANNVYWFCYRQEELKDLPDWLRNHPDVFFVVPEDKSDSAETGATFDRRNAVSISSFSETTLPALEIFERFIDVLDVQPSEIDIDPVNFFIKRLQNALPGLNDSVITSISEYVKSKRQGYQALEDIKCSMAVRNYSEASVHACRLANDIGVKYSDSGLAKELAEITLSLAAQFPGDSQEVACLYDSVAKIAHWLQSEGMADSSVRALVARAWSANGLVLLERKEYAKAIDYFDRVITMFGKDSDSAVLDPVTSSIVNKGIALCRLHEPTQENEESAAIQALYDSIIDRYQNSQALAFRESVASAMVNKAYLLSMIGREEESMQLYNAVIDEFRGALEPAIREHVARAMINKAFSAGAKRRDTRAAIELYRQVVNEFPTAWKPSMRAKLALAWNGLGFQRLLLAKSQLQASQDATETLKAALNAINKAKEFDDNSWLILGNEAYISFLLGDKEKAHASLALALQLGGEQARQAELSDTTVYPLQNDTEFKSWLQDQNAAAQSSGV